MGKLLFLVGAVGLIGSLFGMMKIKSLRQDSDEAAAHGDEADRCGLRRLGWVITLFGMHLTPSTGGRIVLAFVGIGVSLFGIIVVLPAAFNKNAVWKS